MANELLQNASDLINAGQKVAARKILEPYINDNQHDIQAWLLEAQARGTLSEKQKILQMGLEHNPDDKQIKDALVAIETNRDRPIPANAKQKSKTSTNSRWRNGIFVLLILAILFGQGWLFYRVQNLERTSRITQSDLLSTQSQLSSTKTQLASAQSQLNVLTSELAQVSAIAENANRYAHCHPNIMGSCP